MQELFWVEANKYPVLPLDATVATRLIAPRPGLDNPEQLTVLNIVPGMICIVLSFSTRFVTTLSITRETERGTMENLLAMPVRPFEVILAKVIPYVAIGYLEVVLILAISVAVFGLPVRGSVALLVLGLGLFIASNLALGVTLSAIASNQMQVIQMAQFTLLPSFLLSGFMFPFNGMPIWAQWAGELIPMTHALRVVRGLLLKGNGLAEIAPDMPGLTPPRHIPTLPAADIRAATTTLERTSAFKRRPGALERQRWAQGRRREAELNVRFLDGPAGRPIAELGRERRFPILVTSPNQLDCIAAGMAEAQATTARTVSARRCGCARRQSNRPAPLPVG